MAEANVVAEALRLSERKPELPAWPDECRARERSRVTGGDRLDAALVKTDAALVRANARLVGCGDWYEKIRATHGGGR